MDPKTARDVLTSNTSLLAEKVCRTIQAMMNIEFICNGTTAVSRQNSTSDSMVVYMHFSGSVQGYYMLILKEELSLKLIQAFEKGMTATSMRELREEAAGFLDEVLNTSVGQAIVDLEKEFGSLKYFSSIVCYGDVIFPAVASGSSTIMSSLGSITCICSLNMIDLDISKQLKAVQKDLEVKSRQADIDKLTSLYNRTYFDDNFERIIEQSRKENTPLSLVLIDVDFFKQFNDQYGHDIGDFVLIQVAKTIQGVIRGNDVAVRYGGDEMLILCSETDLAGAWVVAQRLTSAIRKISLSSISESISQSITLSIGIAELKDGESSSSFFKSADNQLYKSKRAGRNTIR